MTIKIHKTWDGVPIEQDEHVSIELNLTEINLEIRIDAPFHNDPAPAAQAGSMDGLWEFEVVELFLANQEAREQYVEFEFGPHGHYLFLKFDGVRERSGDPIPFVKYEAKIEGNRWMGKANVPLIWLPKAPWIGNAYAIHGSSENRRYLAAFEVPGRVPDYHQPEWFRSIA
ncbi:MAG: hypothetical protein O3B64_03245 [bacterium]|nr:hypothetical protein [bacterium]